MPGRNGRPPLDADSPSVPVNVRVPAREYDDLYAKARRQGVTVPEVIRRQARLSVLAPKLPTPDDSE